MRHKGNRGFTLAELLVIVAILAVLMALVLPAVQRVREAAMRTQCANNLKQIGLALHQYDEAHRSLPPGCSYQSGKHAQPHLSWCARLLPYLERESLWLQTEQAFLQAPFFETVPPHEALGKVIPVFSCPADGRVWSPRRFGSLQVAFTSYLGMQGTDQFRKDGLLFLDSRVRLVDCRDGTSQTLGVGERPPSADQTMGWWYAGWGQDKDGSGEMILGVREENVNKYYRTNCPLGPYHFQPGDVDNPCSAFHFWSLHPGGAHFLFADGHVRFLKYSANELMPALATRNGREAVELPD